MAREIKLSEMQSLFGTVDFPVSRESVVDQFHDVRVALADGEVNLGTVISRAQEPEFESKRALTETVYSWLPRRAVGEPYQSEGSA